MVYTNPTMEEVEIRRSQLAPFDSINERCALLMFSCIASTIEMFPGKYLDLGSGTGAMVNMARKAGIESYGVDLINGPEQWFIHHDLTKPIHILKDQESGSVEYIESNAQIAFDKTTYRTMKFDLITCLEVAEHLPIESHDILAETIARHLMTGGILVFSSAPPGQSGENHIGCRHPWQWRDLFYDLGLSYRKDTTMQLSHIWSWAAGPLMWLGGNVQVFDT